MSRVDPARALSQAYTLVALRRKSFSVHSDFVRFAAIAGVQRNHSTARMQAGKSFSVSNTRIGHYPISCFKSLATITYSVAFYRYVTEEETSGCA